MPSTWDNLNGGMVPTLESVKDMFSPEYQERFFEAEYARVMQQKQWMEAVDRAIRLAPLLPTAVSAKDYHYSLWVVYGMCDGGSYVPAYALSVLHTYHVQEIVRQMGRVGPALGPTKRVPVEIDGELHVKSV